jgi:hypothetical protein
LIAERLLELDVGDQALGDQQVPETPGLGLPGLCLGHLDLLL